MLKPCPFCGGESEMHTPDSPSMYAYSKKAIPNSAKILRETKYPSGKISTEYIVKEFVPRCTDSSCCGRTTKRYKTKALAEAAWNLRKGIDKS